MARGLDIAAFHGLNPRTGTASAVVGNNNFDTKVTQTVNYDETKPDDCLDTAISMVEDADCEVTGIVINSAVRSDLSKMKATDGNALYPEFRFGGKPSTFRFTSIRCKQYSFIRFRNKRPRNCRGFC